MTDHDGIVDAFTELSQRYETVVDSELGRFWGWRYEEFVDYLLNQTDLNREDKILDIATGTALIPRKLQSKGDFQNRIHGLDITFAMLTQAKLLIDPNHNPDRFCFVCASAMEMPYQNYAFDVIFCNLASHHMDVEKVVSEVHRMLNDHGTLSLADVGGYPVWNIPGLKFFLKVAAFFYFGFKENVKRAWAEAEGVSNIRSVEEWQELLRTMGFEQIEITKMRSRNFWIPQPILIKAKKNPGDKNGNHDRSS
jgi:ubiquinone/menaquinone biosynthesis C-methylase UbiE